ncbi:MAG: LysM peptidoglycan-binding domain-containing protein [Clostridia bacterium]|nr:LysM peptidoglycan-binding domain-containing protein [Clostridia bacterium]
MSIKKTPFPFYQVQKGENLKIISQKYNIDSTKILLDNQMTPQQIKEGMFIILKK